VSDTTYDDLPRQTSTVERAVTLLLMVGLAVLVPIAGFMGLLTSMASDGCMSDNPCNSDLIGLGVAVSALSPAVVFLVALVWVIKRWRARRTTWWVPLVALAGGAALWALGAVITFSAVG
jgi:hypothetical protein